MKKVKSTQNLSNSNTIHVTMYLFPEIYDDFVSIEGAVSYDARTRSYHTDVNPARLINGPLSEYGEEIGQPVKDEYKDFIDDCLWLVKEVGFTVIDTHTSTTSEKSEYILTFGLGDTPCGTLVYDLRISDHPFNATFPKEWKKAALEYLQMNKVLDGSATEAGIDFQIEKVIVGNVRNDTWDKAFNRLYIVLKRMKRQVMIRLKR